MVAALEAGFRPVMKGVRREVWERVSRSVFSSVPEPEIHWHNFRGQYLEKRSELVGWLTNQSQNTTESYKTGLI